MGIYDVVKRKKIAFEKKQYQKQRVKALKQKLDRESLQMEASQARQGIKELHKEQRAKKDIQKYKQIQRKAHPSFLDKIGNVADNFGKVDSSRIGDSSIFGPQPKGKKKRKSKDNDMFSFGGL